MFERALPKFRQCGRGSDTKVALVSWLAAAANFLYVSYTVHSVVANVFYFSTKGSGKGTQSEKIEQDYGLHTMSTGDLLRYAF
jgi:hypothetical protein